MSKKTEEQFRNMFRGHNAVMVLIDSLSGAIEDANQSAVDFYGYPRETLCSMNINDLNVLPPEQIAEERMKALKQERNFFLFPHRLANGEIRTVEVYSSPVQGSEKPLLFSVINDVTKQKKAEAALKESEERYRVLLQSASDGLHILNTDGDLVEANQAFCSMLGYSYRELLGMNVAQWEANLEGRAITQILRKHFAKKEQVVFETTHRRKDGSTIDVEVSGRPIDLAGQSLMIYSARNITERKQSESRIRELSDMLQLVINHIPSFVFWKDLNSNYLGCNNAFAAVAGLDSAEAIAGLSDYDLPWKDKFAESYRADDQSVIRSGIAKLNYEEGQKISDGREIWLQTNKIPLKDAEGNIVGVLGTYEDITGRKKAREKLISANKRLEQANRELSQFAYIASHDLQEPLRTITSFTDLLRRQYGDKFDGKGQKSIEFITDSATRMSQLIKGLLDYSRIGRGQELKPVDCQEIIAIVKSDLEVVIEETGAELEISELPQILAYETEIRLLFQNLILNAIKFRKANTKPHIKIWANREKSCWTFAVKDNGIGIPLKYHDRIFVIFQRLHSRSKYEGTGIGLAHCQKIVELHEGKIWVESLPEEGSTFCFTIPR
ncbi:MAG TPA: PAS domain S-box protein [Calditrichia bacterium]|nr:PAS domain S-box protein [Calditrichota bacterium]HQU73425.1 PAS domain S-box protein [Calditrichia bacterium]HQV33160.1 PAS domain S-box protein [Calditrichia bacterium]